VDVALNPARNNLRVAMMALSVNDERRNQQGLVLHQT
jgi:hypothetical protein